VQKATGQETRVGASRCSSIVSRLAVFSQSFSHPSGFELQRYRYVKVNSIELCVLTEDTYLQNVVG
jgi:hypothetical protein